MATELGVGYLSLLPDMSGLGPAVAKGMGDVAKSAAKAFGIGVEKNLGGVSKAFGAVGKDAGELLAKQALAAAKSDIAKLSKQLATAMDNQASAAGRLRVAEARLAEVRANTSAKLSQIAAAEEAVEAARRRDTKASSAAKTASESLAKAQTREKEAADGLAKAQSEAAKSSDKSGRSAGSRFTQAFRSAFTPNKAVSEGLSKVDGKREGSGLATRFGLGFNGVIGGIISRSTGLFVAGFAAIKSFQVFGSFINDARESAKVGRVTAQVVASTGGAAKISAEQVGNLATAISNKTGADDEAIQSGENLLLTFTNVRNEVGKGNDIFNQASQAAVDMASAMNNGVVDANGLKSANIQLGKALNDPVKGVTALTKVGVSFTQGQKDQIKALVESGNTLAAQKIILKEVGKEFGGAAQAASDPLVRLKTVAGNLSESFGGLLLPAVNKVTNFITDTAIPGIYALGSAFQGEGVTSNGFVGFMERVGVVARSAFDVFKTEVLPRLKEFGGFILGTVVPAVAKLATNLVQTFAPAVKDVFGFFKSDVLPRLKDFAGFLGTSVLPKVSAMASSLSKNKDFLVPFASTILAVVAGLKAWAIIQAVLNAELFANPIGLVVLAIAALVGGLVYAFKHSQKFHDAVIKVFTAVKETAISAFHAIQTAIKIGIAVFGVAKTVVLAVVGAIGTAIHALVTAFFAVKGAISTAIGAVVAAFNAVKTAISAAVSFVKAVWATVIAAISGPAAAIVGVLSAIWSRIYPILVLPFYIAKAIIGTIWTGIKVLFNDAVTFVQTVFAKAWGLIQNVIIAPLDKAWHSVLYVWALIQAGFTAAKDWVINQFSKAWNKVKDTLTGPINTARTFIGDRFSDIQDNFTDAKDWVINTFSKAWNAIKETITKPVSDAKDAIGHLLSNEKAGLQTVFTKAVDAIGKIWDGLQELAKKPVRFIIDTVLNGGLIDGFNWIAGKFKAPTIEHIPKPKGFESGGQFSGRLPGAPSARDNMWGMTAAGPVGLATGEFITNAKDTARALPLLKHINSGGDLPFGFADGGLFGKLKGAAVSAFKAGKSFGGDVYGFLKDPVKWFKDRLNGPLNRLAELGNSPTAEIVKAVPRNLVNTVAGKAKELLGIGGGGFNAGLAGVLDFVRSQVGKPYLWGGVGPNGFDCSGLVSAAINVAMGRNPYQRIGSTGSMPWSMFEPGPGAFEVGWFQGNPGHTAATVNGTNIESAGGVGVRMGPSARGASNPLFTNRMHIRGFANGGLLGDGPFDLLDPRGKRFKGKAVVPQSALLFDGGGVLPVGTSVVQNRTGHPEPLARTDQELDLSEETLRELALLVGAALKDLNVRDIDGKLLGSLRVEAKKTQESTASKLAHEFQVR